MTIGRTIDNSYTFETIAAIADIISGNLTNIMDDYVKYSIVTSRVAEFIQNHSTSKPHGFPAIPDSLHEDGATAVVRVYEDLQVMSSFLRLINEALMKDSASMQAYASVEITKWDNLELELKTAMEVYNASYSNTISLEIEDPLEVDEFIYQKYFMILKEVKAYMKFIVRQFQHLVNSGSVNRLN
ncbi:unnamed protein product [Owenia fusiformis]|uniref:Uncharacterized protein n=1 Tax=Owenia fusiformis TaxID=6347 RepID=A0A8S4N385_OWEFU|nr:unnamed protein product [Owenia fusiformis]